MKALSKFIFTTLAMINLTISPVVSASNLKSDAHCQQYVIGLFNDIRQAENIGMQALRVSLNRIADEQPQYLDIATQIAFGTALDDAGHRRVGQHINALCTQAGSVLFDITYEVLLVESIKLTKATKTTQPHQ